MPLLTGKQNIGHNIKEMEAAGHSRAQSIAASLNKARESGAKIPQTHKDIKMKQDKMAHKEMHHMHKKLKEHHAKELAHHESKMKEHAKHMDAKEDKKLIKKEIKKVMYKKK